MPVEEGTGKSAGFIVVNLSPDVCRSPTAPIPYNIIAFLSDGFKTSEAQGKVVNFQGFPAFNMKSRVTRSFGDTPGVGLGLGSATVQGWCRPITPVVTVKCNGTELCRHEHTKFQMNCLGPEGPGNTIGKVIYLGAMLPGSVPAEGGVPPSANPPLKPDTPKEPSFLDKIKDSLKIESVKDAVDLAQRAYELSQVDWSNPSAALGALAGMAGRAGLGDIAKAINIGKKAVDTDWSDPVSALKAAASIAGDAYSLGNSINKSLEAKENEGRITTKPDKLDADGENTFASPEEQARNKAAIEKAVQESPTGIAIVGGDHAGGASILSPPGSQGFDHVMVAYKEKGPDGKDVVKIAEMQPTGDDAFGRNFGSPNAPSRSLDDAAKGYDSVSAVPVTGLTPDQSAAFLDRMRANTAPGNTYSFVDSSSLSAFGKKGEQCASVIGTSLTQAGIPNSITSDGDFNLVRPDSVLKEFEKINGKTS